MKRLAIAALCFSCACVTTGAIAAEPEGAAISPAEVKWMPAPPVLPKGAQVAVLRGDPFAEGIFTVRLKLPPHYALAPHWHPTAESFSVLEGPFFVGMGDSVDKTKSHAIPAMGFGMMPAMHHHYAYTGDKQVVIDLTGYGPLQLYYVNPSDDPQKAASH